MIGLMAAVQRQVIKASVTKRSVGVIKRIAEEHGMKEHAVAGRIFDWFGEQDDLFQRSVLGMLKGLEVDAAREFMRRMAEKGKPVQLVEVVEAEDDDGEDEPPKKQSRRRAPDASPKA